MLKHFCLYVYVLASFWFAHGQPSINTGIDDLRRSARDGDTEAQFLLFEIIKNYDFQAADSLLVVLQSAIEQENPTIETKVKLLMAQASLDYNKHDYDAMKPKLDSALRIAPDAIFRLDVLRKSANLEFGFDHYQESLGLLVQANLIASVLSDSISISRIYKDLAETYIVSWSLDSARLYLDSAYSFLPQEESIIHHEVRIMDYWQIYQSGELEQALDSAKKLRAVLEPLGKESLINDCDQLIAQVYYHLGNYDGAITYYYNRYRYFREALDRQKCASELSNIAYAYRMSGDFSASIETTMSTIAIYDSLGYELGKANGYLRLYQVYLDNHQTEQQLEVIDKARLIFEKHENLFGIARTHNAYGNTYESLQEYEKSLHHYQESYKIQRTYPKSHWVIPEYNIGNIYVKMGDYEKSIPYFEASLAICEEQHIIGMKIRNLAGLAEANMGINELAIAREFIEEAIPLVKKTQYQRMKRDVFEIASKVYEQAAMYQQALIYHQLFKLQNDSIFNTESDERFADMVVRFETLEKERENELLKKNVLLKEAGIKSQRLWTIIAVVVLFFVMFGAVFFYRNNLILNQKNAEIEEQRNSIEERNRRIETLLKEVHHRVKNNLQLIMSMLDIDNFGGDPKRAFSAMEDSQSRVATMSLIHQNLYMHDELDNISLENYLVGMCENIVELHFDRLDPEIHIEVGKVMFDVDTLLPLGLALNELITNAFKYRPAGQRPFLEILYQQTGKGTHQMTVRDRGPALKQPLEVLVQTGYGLKLASRLVQQLLGQLTHQYDQGNYFTISFLDTNQRKHIE